MTGRVAKTGRTETGLALGMVLASTVVFAIAAYGVMTMAVSRFQQDRFLGADRIRAQQAAEAGLVWAMQKLWVNPAECFTGATDFPIDTDGVGGPDATVDIIRTNLAGGPCPPANPLSRLRAKVVF